MKMDVGTQAALLVAMQQGQRAKAAMSGLTDALADLDNRVIGGIMAKLEEGKELRPAEAIQAWQQLFANRQLHRRLQRVERVGVVSAVAATPLLDGQEVEE